MGCGPSGSARLLAGSGGAGPAPAVQGGQPSPGSALPLLSVAARQACPWHIYSRFNRVPPGCCAGRGPRPGAAAHGGAVRPARLPQGAHAVHSRHGQPPAPHPTHLHPPLDPLGSSCLSVHCVGPRHALAAGSAARLCVPAGRIPSCTTSSSGTGCGCCPSAAHLILPLPPLPPTHPPSPTLPLGLPQAKEAQHQADMRRLAQQYQGQLAAAEQEIQRAKETQAEAAQAEVDALRGQLEEVREVVQQRAQAEAAAARAEAEAAAAVARAALERQLTAAQAAAAEAQQRAGAAEAEAAAARQAAEGAAAAGQQRAGAAEAAAAEARQAAEAAGAELAARRAGLAAQQEAAAAAQLRFELLKKNYEVRGAGGGCTGDHHASVPVLLLACVAAQRGW